jgi:hypothetical protein
MCWPGISVWTAEVVRGLCIANRQGPGGKLENFIAAGSLLLRDCTCSPVEVETYVPIKVLVLYKYCSCFMLVVNTRCSCGMQGSRRSGKGVTGALAAGMIAAVHGPHFEMRRIDVNSARSALPQAKRTPQITIITANWISFGFRVIFEGAQD